MRLKTKVHLKIISGVVSNYSESFVFSCYGQMYRILSILSEFHQEIILSKKSKSKFRNN